MAYLKRIITFLNRHRYDITLIPLEILIYKLLPANKKILLNAWAIFHLSHITKKRNYGDDLNIYILKALSNCYILNSNSLKNKTEHLLAIGSILTYCNKKSIIWGSGVMHPNMPLKEKPKKVLAVRGKLSREYLIKNGVDCPEVYGDPALLLPYIYQPQTEKKYQYGIIAHWQDETDLEYITLFQALSKIGKVKVISLTQYKNWKTVIDQIIECEYILSSSLHGLIISDAYKVPNAWIEFSHPVNGDRFKYYDYFSSVNRDEKLPLIINSDFKINELNKKLNAYQSININLSPLINAAPFKIKLKYKTAISEII